MNRQRRGPPILLSVVLALAACGGPLSLSAPIITPSEAREPTRVQLEPIVTPPRASLVGDFAEPGPAAVLTAAMSQELAGRALSGGEAGGYTVRCALDRMAVRSETSVTEGEERMALYVDLSCRATRALDGAVVWQGALRGRACAETGNMLGSNAGVKHRLLDRTLSDAAREMVADLALRALALQAIPSARVFADEGLEQRTAGLDDTPWGAAALQPGDPSVEHALRSLDPHDPVLRAAAWNVLAMASGPDEPWRGGNALKLDPEPLVRFVQYKALARAGSATSLARLQAAAEHEGDGMLAELARDAVASGGTGLARSHPPRRP
jgi:hypothetical protein